MAMPIVAPLFIENGQLSTTVTIINAMARGTKADVVLLDQQGAEITRQTYALEAHTQRAVKVADVLLAARSGVVFGSAKIETDTEAEKNMGVLGQVSISGTGLGGTVYLEEEFPMTTPFDSGVLRAVAPAALGFPVLALRSNSTLPQSITMTCVYERSGVAQSTVQLAPGELVLSAACVAGSERLPSLDAGWNQKALDPKGSIGISVSSSLEAGSLCVYGFLVAGQADHPIWTALNFTDAGAENSGTTVFSGMPMGHADLLGSDTLTPTLALANFGAKPVNVTVVHAVTSGLGPNGRTVATVAVPSRSGTTVPLTLTGDG